MTKKLSQISKSQHTEINSAQKEAKSAIAQHFILLGNGIMAIPHGAKKCLVNMDSAHPL